MKLYINMHAALAVCLAALTLGAGALSHAEAATAQENLEKLKETKICRGCDLAGLTVNRTNLSGADLEGADLSRTKFFLTNLSGANMRNTNLRGASFGGCDLGAADLRGADLRGTSLEGAYLSDTLLDGEFVTAKPYEDIGVPDVEKQVFIPDPEKPKKSPETREVKVAAPPDGDKTVTTGNKAEAAGRVEVTGDGPQPGAPAVKKAVPVGQAIVEPEAPAGEQIVAESGGVPKPSAKPVANAAGKPSPEESAPKKTAQARKPSPVPPAEVKIDEVHAVNVSAQAPDGDAGEPGRNLAADQGKKDRLARLLKEDKCLGCDLSGLDLSGKNLKNVDLEKANLSGCNLERVIFDKANLKGAILHKAVLRMASLKDADLYRADLSGADLSGADMRGAKLDSAKLSEAIGVNAAGR